MVNHYESFMQEIYLIIVTRYITEMCMVFYGVDFWISYVVHIVLIFSPVKINYAVHLVSICNYVIVFGNFHHFMHHDAICIRDFLDVDKFFLNKVVMHVNYYTRIAVCNHQVVVFVSFYSQVFKDRLSTL